MEVVLVNHNTSAYAELALRTLVARHDLEALGARVTVLDNTSTDDTSRLRAFVDDHAMRFESSGFTTEAGANTHGEALRAFVLRSPPTDAFLFLDADVCFLHDRTVDAMARDLAADEALFGVQAGLLLFITEVLGIVPRSRSVHLDAANLGRGLIRPRPHPFCLLVRDSAVFRSVVEEVGLSCAWRFAADPDHAGWFDTFALATAALATHGLTWKECETEAMHYAQAAERKDPEELMRLKDADCARRLASLRAAT